MSSISDLGTEDAKVLANPKRTDAERAGVHAWFPYYAGFSAGFVSDAITYLGLDRGALLFDPMNGSGTTTLVAQQRGLISIGTELNPAMAILARAKNLLFAEMKHEVEEALNVIGCAIHEPFSVSPAAWATVGWISPTVRVTLGRIATAIDEYSAVRVPLSDGIRLALPPEERTASIADLLRGGLLRLVRTLANPQASKNPTWFKKGVGQATDDRDVYEAFIQIVRAMTEDLKQAGKSPTRGVSDVAVIEADARILPVITSSVDGVVTSPPYLTRIDYAVSTAPELEFLGYDSEESFWAFRASVMGSTCILPDTPTPEESWGQKCLAVLEAVKTHPSKASGTYYYKSHAQYFADAARITGEILRVLKPDRSALLVVQDSWYKDVQIPLGEIYAEMAIESGAAHAAIVNDQAVKVHMGHVNTRARRYNKGPISEQVVLLTKTG